MKNKIEKIMKNKLNREEGLNSEIKLTSKAKTMKDLSHPKRVKVKRKEKNLNQNLFCFLLKIMN